jgi:hypothetical protein
MSQPIFSPPRIRLATLAVAVGMVVLGYLGITRSADVYAYALPILLAICALGMKWAAPAIPLRQLATLIVLIFFAGWLGAWASEHWSLPPLVIVADKAIEVLCVIVFGAHWVKRGYIPQSANYWRS